MVTSIVDAFKRAMSKFRKETSESKVEAVVEQPLSTEKPTSSVSPGRATLSVRSATAITKPENRQEGTQLKAPPKTIAGAVNRPVAAKARTSQSRVAANPGQATRALNHTSNEPWKLKLGNNPKLNTSLHAAPHGHKNLQLKNSGVECQPLRPGGDENARELVMGLDFGTSSLKAVIGDRAAGKAYAVPFMACDGIERYLLPSRLHESDHAFSLSAGRQLHRDLKLSLLASGNTDEAQKRAVVFLALAIRHARAWLFSEKAEIYNGSQVLWRLVVGIPSENIHEHDYTQSEVVQRFMLISHAAWLLSGHHSKTLDLALSTQAIARANEIERGSPTNDPNEEVVVEVIPELSAQIFGFLKSNQFDRHGNKIFAVADIGAGTVDSALFKVTPDRGRWNFEFYTNHVQPYGVMNLHRARVEWWIHALRSIEANHPLIEAFNTVEWPTDRMTSLPEAVEEYVSDAQLTFSDQKHSPDRTFYKKKVLALVQGKTIWRAWKDGFLEQRELEGVPIFLCGGGSRMSYYGQLRTDLKSFPGCTWLKTTPRVLHIPAELEAPGVVQAEYDRLSVAYGLSFLDVGKIVKQIPPQRVPQENTPAWHFTDRFIGPEHV